MITKKTQKPTSFTNEEILEHIFKWALSHVMFRMELGDKGMPEKDLAVLAALRRIFGKK